MEVALWRRIGPRRRRQFFLLVGLMIAASLAEIISIGAILPFLGILTTPERVFSHPVAQPLIHLLGIQSASGLILPVTVLFCSALLVAGAIRVLLLFANTRYSYAVGADLSLEIYRRTLLQPYLVHVSRNSSEIIGAIFGKTAMVIGSVLVPALALVSSSILMTSILFTLLAVSPKIAIGAGAGLALIYWLVLAATRQSLLRNGETIARESTVVVKSLQEGLGGIRDVLIDGTQDVYCRIYRDADRPLRLAQGNSTFISGSPRFGVETLGTILIAALAVGISRTEGGLAGAIPVLGALALGAQRLLPIVQQTYSALATMRGAHAILRDVLALLDQPLPESLPGGEVPAIGFQREIVLQNVGFRYSAEGHWVLRGANLRIGKGQRIGFMGPTGGGKSTLLDIIMGLLPPAEGALVIDGQTIDRRNQHAWQAHLAHVPQSIFLTDSTIAENIAFGVPKGEIDYARVRQAARQAQLEHTIEDLPDKYQTTVGERGVRLSGGQRQRIGIARALYKRADVIVFDEATSALDNETERGVMQAIEALSDELTVLIVAHRLTTLKHCHLIVEVSGGGINRVGQYHELVAAE